MLAGASATVMAPHVLRAQAGPVRIVVPYPPGGSIDTIARLIQPGMQQRLGTTVIVDNRGGAAGAIGAASVAKSAPDGNTWLLCFDTQALNSLTRSEERRVGKECRL